MIMCAEVINIENNQLIVCNCADQQEVIVNTCCSNFKEGDIIKIVYNGIMTLSLPPQINADRIIKISDNRAVRYLTKYNNILKTMINGMCGAELTDSISHNFIVQMIPHHRAAIEMSENILKYISNSDLTDIAQSIISEQTKSIENMQSAAGPCSNFENCSCDINTYQNNVKNITETMFTEMRNAYLNNCISCDFIREMIPHHEGAVRMSKNALRFDICPQLKPILEAIITSQEKGIRQMKCLAKNLRCR